MLGLGQRVQSIQQGNLSRISAVYDSVAVWFTVFPTQSAFQRRIFYGDCNVLDAGEFTPGITPDIPSEAEFERAGISLLDIIEY